MFTEPSRLSLMSWSSPVNYGTVFMCLLYNEIFKVFCLCVIWILSMSGTLFLCLLFWMLTLCHARHSKCMKIKFVCLLKYLIMKVQLYSLLTLKLVRKDWSASVLRTVYPHRKSSQRPLGVGLGRCQIQSGYSNEEKHSCVCPFQPVT